MLFNSPLFLLIFLPCFWLFYFIMPTLNLRNIIIVLFSMVFFAWGDPIFIWYVIAGVWLDYLIIKYILLSTKQSETVKKWGLALAILFDVIALLFFKYTNFFIDQFSPLFHSLGILRPSWYPIALPLGISFIAFHKISFVVDLYKHRTNRPTSLRDALLYILFFPQLIAGPIIRYHEINTQITSREHTYENFLAGIFRFSYGLAKKALIADPCGEIANSVFALPVLSLPTHHAWIGILAYAMQIYFDFSGYSDMAIGLGRSVGFTFPENFNQPYLATSITNFWQRWHMTLSSWMRLYLYIPLGGNRVSSWRMYLNLWIVFLISGFWHGASWTFIFWGAFYGCFLSLEKFYSLRGWNISIPTFLKRLLTFNIVLTAWVFFRAPSITYAAEYICRMYNVLPRSQPISQPFAILFPNHELAIVIVGMLISLIPWSPTVFNFEKIKNIVTRITIRWISGVSLFLLALSSILASGSTSFLYFHF